MKNIRSLLKREMNNLNELIKDFIRMTIANINWYIELGYFNGANIHIKQINNFIEKKNQEVVL